MGYPPLFVTFLSIFVEQSLATGEDCLTKLRNIRITREHLVARVSTGRRPVFMPKNSNLNSVRTGPGDDAFMLARLVCEAKPNLLCAVRQSDRCFEHLPHALTQEKNTH